jgi:hypothetical protein
MDTVKKTVIATLTILAISFVIFCVYAAVTTPARHEEIKRQAEESHSAVVEMETGWAVAARERCYGGVTSWSQNNSKFSYFVTDYYAKKHSKYTWSNWYDCRYNGKNSKTATCKLLHNELQKAWEVNSPECTQDALSKNFSGIK